MTETLLIVILLYLLLLTVLSGAFLRYRQTKDDIQDHKISVIVCARNEKKNISRCLNSIITQHFPANQVEIILADDGSTDGTPELAERLLSLSPFAYRVLRNREHLGKKRTLARAIQESEGEIIITRDADTTCTDKQWLHCMASALRRNDMAIGPVDIETTGGPLSYFEWCENAALTVIAGGSTALGHPLLCSGANLGFRKKAFEQAGGYSSHIHIISGDDVFLLRDLKTTGAKIVYVKDPSAVVSTFSAENPTQLLKQKSRWAGKLIKGQGATALWIAILVLAANLMWIFSLTAVISNAANPVYLIFIFTKIMAELLLIHIAAGFFRRKNILLSAMPVALIYPLYACITGLSSVLLKPSWK